MNFLMILKMLSAMFDVCICIPDGTESFKIFDRDGQAADLFGGNSRDVGVAVTNDMVVVGSQGDHGPIPLQGSSGSVSIFKLKGNTVEQSGIKLRPPGYNSTGKCTECRYGTTVDVNSDFIVVSAHESNKVLIYNSSEPYNLVTVISQNAEWFSYGLSISKDNTLIVGAPRAGKAFIYKYSNDSGNWTLEHELSVPLGSGWVFGEFITTTLNHIVVTDRFADDYNGAVYVFRKNLDGGWDVKNPQTISPSQVERHRGLGYGKVAMDNRRMFIPTNVGKVYAYKLLANGSWSLSVSETIYRSDRKGYEFRGFVHTLALHGNNLVVGAMDTFMNTTQPLHPLSYVGMSLLYGFNNKTNKWDEAVVLRQANTNEYDMFGRVIVMRDKQVFIGSNDMAKGNSIGAVYVYDLSNLTLQAENISSTTTTSTAESTTMTSAPTTTPEKITATAVTTITAATPTTSSPNTTATATTTDANTTIEPVRSSAARTSAFLCRCCTLFFALFSLFLCSSS